MKITKKLEDFYTRQGNNFNSTLSLTNVDDIFMELVKEKIFSVTVTPYEMLKIGQYMCYNTGSDAFKLKFLIDGKVIKFLGVKLTLE